MRDHKNFVLPLADVGRGDVAAQIAAQLDGGPGGTWTDGTEEVPVRGRGGVLQFERYGVDSQALEQIALATGGRTFRARRSSDLDAVYQEIDAFERVARARPGVGPGGLFSAWCILTNSCLPTR